MDSRVLNRFVKLMAILTFLAFSGYAVYAYLDQPAGDYEVRQGDILLGDKEYDKALERFEAALDKQPNHRGALMGRAIVFLQTEQYDRAEAAFEEMIDFLSQTVDASDPTGVGTLAAAYANRGIMYDRLGQYEKALDDYVRALQVDEGATSGPDFIYKILHDPNPSTVRDRARYIYEQLQLPVDQRVMRQPEIDEQQRMYKP